MNDLFEFPMEIDLFPYTKEGLDLEEREAASAEHTCDASGSLHSRANTDDYYNYSLVGVVMHTGTADSGHYYSLIRDREYKYQQMSQNATLNR